MRRLHAAVALLTYLFVIVTSISSRPAACPMESHASATHHTMPPDHQHQSSHCADLCLPGSCTMSTGCSLGATATTIAGASPELGDAGVVRRATIAPPSFLSQPETPPPRA